MIGATPERIMNLAVYYRMRGYTSEVIAYKLQITVEEADDLISKYGGYAATVVPTRDTDVDGSPIPKV